jgi:hypothetical protein
MNRIIEVKLRLTDDGWSIDVTKEFAPEYGGGTQTFSDYVGGAANVHRALDVARGMVTLHPSWRTDL